MMRPWLLHLAVLYAKAILLMQNRGNARGVLVRAGGKVISLLRKARGIRMANIVNGMVFWGASGKNFGVGKICLYK